MHFHAVLSLGTRRIHRLLVFYSSKLQNPNPKPGFEGVQTRNPALEIVVRVGIPGLYGRCYKTVSGSGRPNFNALA